MPSFFGGKSHGAFGQPAFFLAGNCMTTIAFEKEFFLKAYRVALNFCGSFISGIGDFLCFAGTNFCDLKRLVFLAGN